MLRRVVAGLLVGLGAVCAQAQPTPLLPPAPLKVCMAEDNGVLSQARHGQVQGFDRLLAQAIASALGRELQPVPFEAETDTDSPLAFEVNALLSAGVCELATGFPLLQSDLAPPTRALFRTPDHLGAKPRRERPLVPLGRLAASQPYHAMALTVVQRLGAAPVTRLADLAGRKVGAVAGTLEGTLVLMYRQGLLVPGMVTLSQREDGWAALAAGRIDALLVSAAAWDSWRQRQPEAVLQAGPLVLPLGINLGLVALDSRPELLAAADRVLAQALAQGELARWAQASGLSWTAPTQPAVSAGLALAELLR